MPDYEFSVDWWSNDHLHNFKNLKRHFQGIQDLSFLEVGCFEGRTTTWLLDHILINPKDKITCIDLNFPEQFDQNILPHGDKVRVRTGTSSESLMTLLLEHELFDFIYIDADHNAFAVLRDLILAWDLLKKDGIMLMDDYLYTDFDISFYSNQKEFFLYPNFVLTPPKKAIDVFLDIYKGQYDIFCNNYQMGIKKLFYYEYKK
jgi:hypothetical protein